MTHTLTLFVLATLSHVVFAQTPAMCAAADECRQRARDAIAAAEYERAHDLAWLAYQKGPKQDPATLTLLARAQSLSGRADDAFVMLRRLAEAGVVVEDVAEGEDFRRVRSHPQWPQLLALFANAKARIDGSRVEASSTQESAAHAPAEPARAKALPEARAATSTPPAIVMTTPTRASDDLLVTAPITQPTVMAYDSVSARFVLGSPATDALTVISQMSANATSFTSRGWSGHDATTAIALDRAAGDLWVAAGGAGGASLHRLQLISGRRLEAIELPADTPAELVALTLTADGLLALDRAGHRVLRRARSAKALDVFFTLPDDIRPTSLTSSPQALFVAHDRGLLRITAGSRRPREVTGPGTHTLGGLRSIAWHNNVLLGVQQFEDRMAIVRLHLNGAGTAVTKIDVVDTAAATAATLSGGVYYYLANNPDGSRAILRAIVAK